MPSGNPSRPLVASACSRRSRIPPTHEHATNGRAHAQIQTRQTECCPVRQHVGAQTGAAMRLPAVLLREDVSTLERRVRENEVSAKS